MTVNDHVRELLAAPMRSPTNFATYLGMRPLSDCKELLDAMHDADGADGGESAFQTGEIPSGGAIRAVALYALWRTIRLQGTRTTVLAADPQLAREFMQFLYDVAMRTTPAIFHVTRFRRWNHVEIGSAPGWDLKVLRPLAHHVADRAPLTTTAVILGAASSDPGFLEAVRELESGVVSPKKYVIRLW